MYQKYTDEYKKKKKDLTELENEYNTETEEGRKRMAEYLKLE